MGTNLFGGLMKGLGAFMPKDDPNVKLFQAQSELNELESRQQELYAEIGKSVFESIKEKPEFQEIVTELNFISKKILSMETELEEAENIKSEHERLQQERIQERTCPNCDTVNPEGVKFCQECGEKLSFSVKPRCPQCGTENPVGTRFCGECGGKF